MANKFWGEYLLYCPGTNILDISSFLRNALFSHFSLNQNGLIDLLTRKGSIFFINEYAVLHRR